MSQSLLNQGSTPSEGFDLRRERERQELSLDQASEQTSIPRRYLEALETEDETVLPTGTFHRQYRRQYLLFLGYPDIAESMNNLASTYIDLGRHDDALRLEEETLAFNKRILPSDHPDTRDQENC